MGRIPRHVASAVPDEGPFGVARSGEPAGSAVRFLQNCRRLRAAASDSLRSAYAPLGAGWQARCFRVGPQTRLLFCAFGGIAGARLVTLQLAGMERPRARVSIRICL